MKRHRKNANEIRHFLGRGMFARGPKATNTMNIPHKFLYMDCLPHRPTDDEKDLLQIDMTDNLSSQLVAPEEQNCDGMNDGLNADGQVMVLMDNDQNAFGGESVADPIPRNLNRQDLAGFGISKNEVVSEQMPLNCTSVDAYEDTALNDAPMAQQDEGMDMDVVAENLALNTHQPNDHLISDTMIEESDHLGGEHFEIAIEDEDEELIPLSKIPGLLAWIRSNKGWIDLYYKYASEEAVMNTILKLLAAPCKTWKTAVANIGRPSGLIPEVEKHQTCPTHMCFASLHGSEEVQFCSVCGNERPSETEAPADQVTYIPLLPRIAHIVANERKRTDLYDYRRNVWSSGSHLSDYFGSPAYQELIESYGGEESTRDDVFLSMSTDGYQAFKNNSCGVWPVIAVLMNLPPNQRYAAKNIMPLMFIPGGREPKDLQSYLVPFVNELQSILDSDGVLLRFFDGVERKVRLHLVWFMTDLTAMRKCASLTGHRGKTPCRFCLIQGLYVPASKGYYYPSSVLPSPESSRRRILFNTRRLPSRTRGNFEAALLSLSACNHRAEREEIMKETGIQGRSVICSLPSIVRFWSFPPDIMHLCYNVQKLLLSHHTGCLDEPFTLSDVTVQLLDDEIVSFGKGVSRQIAPTPRRLSDWRRWKAAEDKHFTFSYCLVLFDGHLPPEYLSGLEFFVELTDICYRCAIADEDAEFATALGAQFVEHYESKSMRHMLSRATFCTYVVHLLQHLGEAMQRGGPLIGASQYCMEKYIGWISERTNARRLPAASLTKSAIFNETYKIFFTIPFHEDDQLVQEVSSSGGFSFYGRMKSDERDWARLRVSISNYFLRKFAGMGEGFAKNLAADASGLQLRSRVRFLSGAGTQVASAYCEDSTTRPSCFVATEYEDREDHVDVYYGRIRRILEFEVKSDVSSMTSSEGLSSEWAGHYRLLEFDWAQSLRKGSQGQVFIPCSRTSAFSAATIEDATILARLIGVVEQAVPRTVAQTQPGDGSTRSRSARRRKRTYFIDELRRAHRLLHPPKLSPDGVNRVLQGML